MAKVIFILQRRHDKTPEEVREHWSGEHIPYVRQIPGLSRYVENYVLASPAGHVCDGVGELWFDTDEAMSQALESPQMQAALEDGATFLDMDKTRMIIVEERTWNVAEEARRQAVRREDGYVS